MVGVSSIPLCAAIDVDNKPTTTLTAFHAMTDLRADKHLASQAKERRKDVLTGFDVVAKLLSALPTKHPQLETCAARENAHISKNRLSGSVSS